MYNVTNTEFLQSFLLWWNFDFDISYEIFLNKIINLILIVTYDSF